MLDKDYFYKQIIRQVEDSHDKKYSERQIDIIYSKISHLSRVQAGSISEAMTEEPYMPKPGKWARAADGLAVQRDNNNRHLRHEVVIVCDCGSSFSVLDRSQDAGYACPGKYYGKCNKSYSRAYVDELRGKYGRDVFMEEIPRSG